MPSLRRLFGGLYVSAMLIVTAPLQAQLTTSLEAFTAYYRPFGEFAPGSSILAGQLPEHPADLRSRAWGAAAHVSSGRRGVSVQLEATTNSRVSAVMPPGGGGLRGPTDAYIVIGTLKGQYDVSPSPNAFHSRLNAGLGFVRHGGDAYRPFRSPTSLAGSRLEHGSRRDALLHVGLAWVHHQCSSSNKRCT
jgi:hypothetical protein